LKNQIDKSQSPYEIEKLQERMSKMIGGVAIINVGGGTEIEMKEKKDRLEDALQATKAALEEGILPGAGVALLHAREAITYAKVDGEDFNKGKRIVSAACKAPFAQILTNAGENHYEWLIQLKDHNEDSSLVPNIEEEILVDAYSSGIIDPTKVVRSALENAAAAAVTLLMTECVIHEKPSDKKADAGMDMMGGMGM
jgi:chaperonin GroEL